MKLRIGQIRITPDKGRLDANHEALMAALRDLADQKVDVLVTPECFLDGYAATEPTVSAPELRSLAIDLASSRYVAEAARWAGEHRAWMIYGCTRLDGGKVFNSALVIDRAGQLMGCYDKTHCQTHDAKFAPGGALPVFEADFGAFGVMICADRRWPETVRTLALRGARVIFNPTYGMHSPFNTQLMRVRSYESEVFIAFTHPRLSLVTGPGGDLLTEDTSTERCWTVTEVDLSEVDRVRAGAGAHLRDRRSELYEY